jgi:UrcA family protein
MTHLRIALLTGAFALTALPAAAQGLTHDAAYMAPSTSEDVTVYAPREWMHRGAGGAVSLSREVSYADLDLSTRTGVRALRERVRFTARDVCEELKGRTDDRFLSGMDVNDCARQAYRGAMSQVRTAVADARGNNEDDDNYR